MISGKTIGAIAANLAAMSFIIGFALYFTVLKDANYARLDLPHLSQLQFLIKNQSLMHFWYLIIYVFFGSALALLCLVLHQRLYPESPLMTSLASVFGLVWVGLVVASGLVVTTGNRHVIEVYPQDRGQAVDLWLVVQVVTNALGGGNEIIGGLWIFLISLAALQSKGLSKTLGLSGLVIGSAGVLTIIPAWEVLAAVFGFGCILWFGGLSALWFSEQRHD